MDTLLVLRRPLNPNGSTAKFIKPVKAKIKGVSAKPSLRPESQSPPNDARPGAAPQISFVKLYNELCLRAGRPESAQGRRTADASTEFTSTGAHIFSESADSVLKTYLVRANKIKNYPKIDKRRVTAEVVLELGYDRKTKR